MTDLYWIQPIFLYNEHVLCKTLGQKGSTWVQFEPYLSQPGRDTYFEYHFYNKHMPTDLISNIYNTWIVKHLYLCPILEHE